MYWITKTMYTETAHRLPGHPKLCKNLHGHSYKWEISAGSQDLNEAGMVMDFSDLKNLMSMLVEPFDHAVVVTPEDTALMEYVNKTGQRHVVMKELPTAENMAQSVKDFLVAAEPRFHFKVRLWETTTSYTEV